MSDRTTNPQVGRLSTGNARRVVDTYGVSGRQADADADAVEVCEVFRKEHLGVLKSPQGD